MSSNFWWHKQDVRWLRVSVGVRRYRGGRGRRGHACVSRLEPLLALRREPFLDGFAFQAGARVGRRSISLAKHYALSRVFRFIRPSIGKIFAGGEFRSTNERRPIKFPLFFSFLSETLRVLRDIFRIVHNINFWKINFWNIKKVKRIV